MEEEQSLKSELLISSLLEVASVDSVDIDRFSNAGSGERVSPFTSPPSLFSARFTSAAVISIMVVLFIESRRNGNSEEIE